MHIFGFRAPRCVLILLAVAALALGAGCDDDDGTNGTVEPDPGGVEDWTGNWSRSLIVTGCDDGAATVATVEDTLVVCPADTAGDVFDPAGDGSAGQFWLCDDFAWTGTTGRLVCDVLITDVAFLDCIFDYDVDITVVRDGDRFTWDARVQWNPIEGCVGALEAGCLEQSGTGMRIDRDTAACGDDPPVVAEIDVTVTDGIGTGAYLATTFAGNRTLGRTFVQSSSATTERERILNVSVPTAGADTAQLGLEALPAGSDDPLPADAGVLFYLDLRADTDSTTQAWVLDTFDGTVDYVSGDADFDATVDGTGTLVRILDEGVPGPAPTETLTLSGDIRVPVRVITPPESIEARAARTIDRVLRRALRAQ